MAWDRTGQIIRGIYFEIGSFTGKVVWSSLSDSGQIVHTVELYSPLEIYGKMYNKLSIRENDIFAMC